MSFVRLDVLDVLPHSYTHYPPASYARDAIG
jgi:hypothetical protein